MNHISKYKVDKPYPKVRIDIKNTNYASLLLDDYAGIVSEYSAISQYIYGHILAGESQAADIFLGIAIVEMTHLDMLGDVIIDLGVAAKFVDGKGEVWNSDLVPYGDATTRSRVELAIKAEHETVEQYRDHIMKIENEDIVKLLERIILDEQLHARIFESLLEKCN